MKVILLEVLIEAMIPPDKFRFVQSHGLLEVQQLPLVLVQHHFGQLLGVEDLLHDDADVHLLPDFLQRVVVFAHLLPRQVRPELGEEQVHDVAQVDEEVEALGVQGLVLPVVVEVLGDFEFVGELGEEGHDDQDGQDGAEEAADVGEGVVGLAEGALDQDVLGGLAEVELHVLVVLDVVVVDLGELGDDAAGVVLDVVEGVDGLVGADGVGGHVDVGVDAGGGAEGEVVHVLQVVVQVGVRLPVDDLVHEVEVEVEGLLRVQVVADHAARHAGPARHQARVALLHRELVELELLRSVLALQFDLHALRRAQPLLEPQPVVDGPVALVDRRPLGPRAGHHLDVGFVSGFRVVAPELHVDVEPPISLVQVQPIDPDSECEVSRWDCIITWINVFEVYGFGADIDFIEGVDGGACEDGNEDCHHDD